MLRTATRRWCTGSPTREQLMRLKIKDLNELAAKKRLNTSDCVEKAHIVDKILGQDVKVVEQHEKRQYTEVGFFTQKEKTALTALGGLLVLYVAYRVWKSMEDDEITQLRKATEAGDIPATKELARRLLHGEGVQVPEPETAFKLLKGLSDEQKDPWAQCELAGMFCRGQGTEEDLKECFRYMLSSAKMGHINAMYNVADLYKMGVGVPQDREKSMRWKMDALGATGEASADFNPTPNAESD